MNNNIVPITVLLLFVSGCFCDFKDNEIHEVAYGKGCKVYQVGCNRLFFTKCSKTKNITTRECHQEYNGKATTTVCTQNETIND